MSQWYQQKYRRTLLDMHIPDWNDKFLKQFDPEAYFKALKRANVNAPMIYVQSHTGLCNWPTRSGRMHQGFAGCEDKMTRLFDLCRQDGMSVILYYSLIYNCEEAYRHPEWRMRSVDGGDCFQKGSRYGVCCPNNKKYREFVKAQIEEFSAYFDFEGVFFDMPFWPMNCYCDSCKRRWAEEAGGEMPRIVDWKNPRWRQLAEKRNEWMGEFAQFATDTIKALRPEVSVEHQYGNSLRYWRFGQNELISAASDYIGTDLYGGIEEQSFACKTWYNLTQNQPFQYMTSRCYPELAEHTTTKTPDQLRLHVMTTYAHHGAPLLIDAVDPVGTIDGRVYDLMGDIYREAEPFEKYAARGKMAYDVALYYDLNGKMNVELNGDSVEALENSEYYEPVKRNGFPHHYAAMGAANALRKHHIPYGVINNWKLELLNGPKVVVISDDPGMKGREINAVREYVQNGGALYLSGHSAPELVEEIFQVKWEGPTQETYTYLAPAGASDIMQGEFTREHPLPMPERAMRVSGTPRGTVLAHLTLPWSIPTPKLVFPMEYYGKPVPQDGQNVRFGSIHSNPPGEPTDIPAMLYADYGKGRVIWSALPIEKAIIPQHSRIFAGIIRRLMGNQPFAFGAEAADSVECILFDAPEHRQKLISLINLQEDFNTLPAIDSKIWVRTAKKPVSVLSLPDEKPVNFSWQDGRVEFTVDILKQFKMFAINEA